MKKPLKVMSTFALAGLILSACQNAPTNNTADQSNQGNNTPVNNNQTAAGDKQNEGFPNWGYDLQATRHVPYKQLTEDNIKDLGVIWKADFKKIDADIPNGNQCFPVVVDGVLYVSTSHNYLFAFDAVTGKQLWEWKPEKEVLDHIKKMGIPGSNRGISVAEGKVFMLIADDRLAAIDAKTGKTSKIVNLWDSIPDVKAENGYYEGTSTIYYKGNIYIGSSGGDNGVRGFVMAYKASDLSPAWDEPFWTVPPKGQGWLKDSKFAGGGAVWNPVAIDPDTDIMYFGVGNPAPDFYGKARPGDNPHTDSVVALNSQTGKLVWAKQEITHDLWDYDAAATPMLIKATINGKEKKVVVQGGKSAQWWAWDAATGDVIYDGVAFGKIQHPEPTEKGVLVYPGVLGGENYAPETYDPGSNYVLIPGIESPSLLTKAKDSGVLEKNRKEKSFGVWDMGTEFAPAPSDIKSYGTITAIDMNTGKVAYQNKTDDPMRGGFTSTDSGLAFYGELDGSVNAINIKTGKTVWDFQTEGNSISSAPAIFTQDGKQYVAYTTGGAKPMVTVFGIGGDKSQSDTKQEGKSNNPHDKAN